MKKLTPLFLLFLLFGCGRTALVQDQWEALDVGHWSEDDMLSINFEVKDSTQRYDLIVGLTHSTNFGFQNLYIEVSNLTPNGDTMSTPVSLELANSKGQWQGQCSDEECKATIPLRENFYFQNLGKYTITMRPHMRVNPVPDVYKASLALYPVFVK